MNLKNTRRDFLKLMGFGAGAFFVSGCANGVKLFAKENSAVKPNIVYILADDMGYGDIQYLNKECKISTPNLNRLAQGGMIFMDAHSGSAVCTPTRYGILTGRYCWRTIKKSGVLMGYDKPLIAPERMTVGSFLKKQGYYTGCIGKWHLGMDFARKDSTSQTQNETSVDFSKPIANGPVDVGFDYFYGISASLDMPPYVYIENNRFTAVPTEITKEGGREGLTADGFKAVDVLPTITKKAIEYIEQRGKKASDQPFFLYFALSAPHTPIVPSKEFIGKSKTTQYGDFCEEVDSTVGQVLDAIERSGRADNTIVIFTSDNGCSPAADFPELAKFGHNPSYIFRGYKADIFEGGHHIPFIVRWPGRVKKASRCDDTICLTDLMATCADILGEKLPDNAGEDSVSILPDLLGTAKGPVREATVHHSINGAFSIRYGKWKLELCPGSGGWSYPKPGKDDTLGMPSVQLYDLSEDIAEKKNVQDKYPDQVKRLTDLLQSYVDRGRSTPGLPQSNEGKTDIFLGTQRPKKRNTNKK